MCRATPSRLRSNNWRPKAMSAFPPGAGRRSPKACRSMAARRRRKQAASPAERLPLSPWARGLQRAIWPPVYDTRPRPFQPGLADEREFPHELWSRCLRRAARNALSRRDRTLNHPPLQQALLAHLAVHRGIKAKPSQILIVPTAQAGLAMIANVLLSRGDHAWIESPGYGGAHVALQAAGAVVTAIPLDRTRHHGSRPQARAAPDLRHPVASISDRADDADRPPARTHSLRRRGRAHLLSKTTMTASFITKRVPSPRCRGSRRRAAPSISAPFRNRPMPISVSAMSWCPNRWSRPSNWRSATWDCWRRSRRRMRWPSSSRPAPISRICAG